MKTVLITGINRGLGRQLFDVFLSKKYTVYGVVRNQPSVENISEGMPPNRKVIIADLSSDESMAIIRKSVQNNAIDLVINNAGIGGKTFQLSDVDTNEINEVFNIHCLGVIRTSKALQSNLLQAEDPIVLNINSRFGSIGRQSNGTYKDLTVSYSYRIAKAAQNMLTNCLRIEFNERIQFISLHPGRMKTNLAQSDADLEPSEVAQRILKAYENGKLKEEEGIVELENEVIEW